MSTPLPQHCPSPRELDDLELLTTGALAPLVAFNAPGSPVTLSLPHELAGADRVELVDPEGLPLATYDVATGEVAALTHAQHGPFRSLHLTPAQARERYAGRTVVPVAGPLTTAELDELSGLGPVLLLALAGHGTGDLSPVALVRATTAAARLLPDAAVVVVPLAAHDDPQADHALGAQVVATYAGGDPVHALAEPTTEDYPADIAEIVDFDRPAPQEQGLVLFFTGLSGSGKSTLAQALMDRLLERGGRTVTSLDGDVVRRNLSKGLTFSKEDRETNIRRIGWVAAEIARHGGVAVCSPIAPFAETRAQVREMVEDAGGAFFLVHVATPLEECERRDRKGLYAKARRGEIPEFTGISSPYEEPDDAAVRVDTTGRTIEDALGDVVDELAATGYLDLRDGVDGTADSGGSAEEPLEVLFVCTANICRSPYMEHVARSLADEAAGDGQPVSFTSAGVQGFVDEPMDETMAATLPGGADGFRSRRLSAAMVEQADLLLTADAGHRAAVLEEHPAAVRKTFTLGQFAAAAEAADPALHGRGLIARIGEQRPAADPEHDIADPYRRGADAAQEAAGRISTMLSVIVKRLQGA